MDFNATLMIKLLLIIRYKFRYMVPSNVKYWGHTKTLYTSQWVDPQSTFNTEDPYNRYNKDINSIYSLSYLIPVVLLHVLYWPICRALIQDKFLESIHPDISPSARFLKSESWPFLDKKSRKLVQQSVILPLFVWQWEFFNFGLSVWICIDLILVWISVWQLNTWKVLSSGKLLLNVEFWLELSDSENVWLFNFLKYLVLYKLKIVLLPFLFLDDIFVLNVHAVYFNIWTLYHKAWIQRWLVILCSKGNFILDSYMWVSLHTMKDYFDVK